MIEGAHQEYLPLHCYLARDYARRGFEGHLDFGWISEPAEIRVICLPWCDVEFFLFKKLALVPRSIKSCTWKKNTSWICLQRRHLIKGRNKIYLLWTLVKCHLLCVLFKSLPSNEDWPCDVSGISGISTGSWWIHTFFFLSSKETFYCH